MPARAEQECRDNLRVGEGKLGGKGVYAAREFAPGEVVVAFTLEPLTREQYRALPPGDELFVHSYGGRRWLYPPPARWVNHHDEPSCDQDFERCCDVARRHIGVGEAITIDANQETRHELSTFLDAYVRAQRDRDRDSLRDLVAADAVLWVGGTATRGGTDVASALATRGLDTLSTPEWQVGTGRWEALCSVDLIDAGGSSHVSLLLRVLEGNWQVVYDHRG